MRPYDQEVKSRTTTELAHALLVASEDVCIILHTDTRCKCLNRLRSACINFRSGTQMGAFLVPIDGTLPSHGCGEASQCRDKYEAELENAAAILKQVLPIGSVKAIGLLEVCAGIKTLVEDLARTRQRLRDEQDERRHMARSPNCVCARCERARNEANPC